MANGPKMGKIYFSAELNKANRPTMRPQRFAFCDCGGGRGGGGGGGSGGGVGGSGGVAGGRGISWDGPLLKESSIFSFIEKA